MDLGEPLYTEDKAKIKFSVTHTGIENLRAELANYDEVTQGLDLEDLSADRIKALVIQARISRKIIKPGKSKSTPQMTTWCQSKKSTASTASTASDEDEPDESKHSATSKAQPPSTSTSSTDPTAMITVFMAAMQQQTLQAELRAEKVRKEERLEAERVRKK